MLCVIPEKIGRLRTRRVEAAFQPAAVNADVPMRRSAIREASEGPSSEP
jgi:hypothetical protein